MKSKAKGRLAEFIARVYFRFKGYKIISSNYITGKGCGAGEIDFIATKFKEKIYIQVAYILADQNIIDREFGAYKKIDDNYPKYVITMDKFDLSQNGIIHKNIIEWLLNN